MRTLLPLVFALVLAHCSLMAQSYNFTSSTSTYTPLTAGTQIIGGDLDDAFSAGLPIGFNFTYYGQVYSYFKANSNGFINLDTSEFTGSYTNELASLTKKTIIGALWDDLKTNVNGGVRYALSGTTPSRILSVEFYDVTHLSQTYQMRFMIRLHETTNMIEFHYDSLGTWTSAESASIGLNDHVGGAGHFISVTPGAPPTTSTMIADDNIQYATNLPAGTKYSFSYVPPAPKDLKMLAWIAPEYICGADTAVPITVKIANVGLAAQDSFLVSYSIDNGLTFITPELVLTSLPGNDTMTYTFTTTANMSTAGQLYHCVAAVSLTGDANTANDTLDGISVQNYNQITSLPFLEGFESGNTYLALTQNVQAGVEVLAGSGLPGYSLHFTGGAATGWTGSSTSGDSVAAWITNVTHHAFAQSCPIDASTLTSLKLNLDFKVISSFGTRYAWFRILVNDSIQLEDVNGTENFNATTIPPDTWTNLEFDLDAFAGTTFTLTLQAACKYNTNGGGDHVYIDNIVLSSVVMNDAGILNIIGPSGQQCTNATTGAPVRVLLKNFGADTLTSIPLNVRITPPSGNPVIQTFQYASTLLPGASDTVTVDTFSVSEAGEHLIEAFTTLANDPVSFNDTATGYYYGVGPINVFPFSEDFETGNDHFMLHHEIGAAAVINVETGANHALMFEGGDANYGWFGSGGSVTPTNAWVDNFAHHAWAYTCQVDASGMGSLIMEFDLRQTNTFGYTDYSWFRVLVNGTQVADTSGRSDFNATTSTSDPWGHVVFDLSAYAGTQFEIRLQAACKYNSTYNLTYPGDRVWIDNLLMTGFQGQPLQATAGADTIVCAGTTAQLDVSATGGLPPYTYLWSPANPLNDPGLAQPLATPMATTTFHVTVTDSVGNQATAMQTVTVNDLPVVTFAGLPIFSITGQPYPLTQGSPAGGTYWGPGVYMGIFDPASLSIGTYTLIYYYTDPVTGCTNSDSAVAQVGTVGFIENDPDQMVELFPVPSTGTFCLALGTCRKAELQVYSTAGVLIHTAGLSGRSMYEINIPSLVPGAYLLRVTTPEWTASKRLIIR